MLFPTQEAHQRAAVLQSMGMNEAETSATEGTPREVAIATIHGRQDLVLIYSMLSSCHEQSVNISRGVWALVAIGLLILVRMAA